MFIMMAYKFKMEQKRPVEYVLLLLNGWSKYKGFSGIAFL